MKSVKLVPHRKEHVVGYPFKVDVGDPFIDLDDATHVKAWLGYQKKLKDTMTPSTDMPGNSLYLHGPWIDVKPIIEEIIPTDPGFYTVVVEAFLNIAPSPLPKRFAKVIYHGVKVSVVAKT
jgi:hypothetical protein